MASRAMAAFKPLKEWVMRYPLRAALLGLLLFGLGACVTTTPRNDRDWYPYLSHTSDATLTETGFAVTPVSDWTYEGPEVVAETYGAAAYDYADLRRVWFMLEPQPGSQLAAHTLLLFEFEDDRLLGLTIEARREQGEEYSAFFGLWNRFELAYIWASARDLLTRRAVMLNHEVFLYPIDLTDSAETQLLRSVLERTEALETHPRFYNTLYSNCTNELAKAANLPWTPSYVFTGRSDNFLFRKGLIAGEDFEDTEARADITEFLRNVNRDGGADFDARLLAEMRRRFDGSSGGS
jgi:hypothetical protein